MKFKIIFSFLAMCLSFASLAQDADILWSDDMPVDEKKQGFYQGIFGEKDEILYTAFASNGKGNSLKLVSFDKKSLKKENEVTVNGFGKSSQATQYKGLYNYKNVVLNEVIYIFWKKAESKTEELYAQSFSLDLKPLEPLKKIFKIDTDVKRGKGTKMFVIVNRDAKSKIVVGIEDGEGEENDVYLDYKILNEDLSFSESNRVELGYSWGKKRNNYLTSSYVLLDNNTLVSHTNVTEEIESDTRRKKYRRYFNMTAINLATNEYKPYKLKDDDRAYYEVNFISSENGATLTGFYSDLTLDPDGSKTHGLFFASMDASNNFSPVTVQEFTPEFVEELYPKKDTQNMSERKKKKEAAKEERMLNLLTIEQVEITPDGPILFCSLMYNYSVTTCDSKGNCTTRYYCQKTNVYTLALDKYNKIKWHNVIKRGMTYSGWNVFDLVVAPLGENYFVTYGDAIIEATGTGKKQKAKRKSKEMMRDNLEYSIITPNGADSKKTIKLNSPSTPKEKRKKVSATNSYQRVGDDLYIQSDNTKLKFGFYPMYCLTCGMAMLNPYPYMYGQTTIGKLILED